jgi:hypothetical protein
MPKGQHKRDLRWKHPHKFYAKLYGVSPDAISRAVRSGKVALDDEISVKEWLKNKRRGPRKAVRGERAQPALVRVATNGSNGQRALGLNAGIQSLQKSEAFLADQYESALKTGETSTIRFWREEWTTVFDQLRRIEAINPGIQKEKGEMMRVADAERLVFELVNGFERLLAAAPNRLAHKLFGLDVPQIITELEREREVLYRFLRLFGTKHLLQKFPKEI